MCSCDARTLYRFDHFPTNVHLQVHREFRKPLIVAAPKKLLRLKAACSDLSEMGEDTMFLRVISETSEEVRDNADDVKRLILCSGQFYYDLVSEREKVCNGCYLSVYLPFTE